MRLSIAVVLFAVAAAATAAESPPAGQRFVGAGYAFRPDPADYYPSASRELQEEGLTKLRLCYDDRGRPFEVTVEQSSGFVRLDEAAVRYGKAVRIRPGTIDGQPQPDCIVVPVRFSPDTSPQQSPRQGEQLPLPPVEVPPILKDIPLPPPPPMPIPLAPSRAPGSVGT